MTFHKALYLRDDIDSICQKRRRKASHHHGRLCSCDNSRMQRTQKITAANDSYINRNNLRTNRKTTIKNLENKNGKKNNCMDTSSNKLKKIAHGMTWTWLRRGNLKRETESLLITAQNYTIRTDYIKVKIVNTQNSKYGLCGDRIQAVNDIIRKCNQLAPKKYKTMAWLDGKNLTLLTNMWKPVSVLENEKLEKEWLQDQRKWFESKKKMTFLFVLKLLL